MPARGLRWSFTGELRPVITTGAEVMDQIFRPMEQRRGTVAAAALPQAMTVIRRPGNCWTAMASGCPPRSPLRNGVTGIDVVYPAENRKITDQILASGGAILSEFPLGTFPAPQNFPIRNRLIRGIAIGVLVLEAGEFSGTRVTARCALEQGREVFAVPGNVTNKLSWGPNTLIKQGAALVATWEDVWEALPADVRLALTPPEPAASEEGVPSSLFEAAQLPPSEKRVYALMRADESIHIDQLVERLASYLSSSEIFSALFELELSGRIRQLRWLCRAAPTASVGHRRGSQGSLWDTWKYSLHA